jgi:Putative zinc-finger
VSHMTHADVQHANVSDRYVMGKLSGQEQASFEEHLLDCQECLDRVEALGHLSRGLRTALSESSKMETVLLPGLIARFAQLARWQQRALALAALMLILVPAATAYLVQVMAERQLRHANEALADFRHDYAEKQKAVDELNEQLRASTARVQQTEAQLLQDRASQTKEQQQLSASLQLEALASAPVFSLNASRGAGTDQSPPKEISLDHSPKELILSLELEPDPDAATYRVAISRDRRPFWAAAGLKPSDKGAIAIIVSGGLLMPGDYAIDLKSCPRQRTCYTTATYLFRVTPSD